MMSLLQAAKILNGEVQGENLEFSSVSTDTRTIKSGDLYVALHGERFDGHDYVEQAEKAGAVAAVVHRDIATKLPYIKVEDTRKALGKLAAAWRQVFEGKVVAVTGSNGKTTVKEMITAILKKQGKVMATEGNFNNDIGLPLTLLRMAKENFAVIEMGANHPGEISNLTEITQPDIAVINNAGSAHLDGFGSLKGVAAAKAEIYEGLQEGGVAVINKDDNYGEYWLSLCEKYQILTFSMRDKSANVYGEWEASRSGGNLKVNVSEENEPLKEFYVQLRLPGIHNAMNALAAIAVVVALHVPEEKIVQALNEFEPVKGRLNVYYSGDGVTVIDDTYNANPASLAAGIDVLNELAGEHWLVLGDMGELGEDEARFHFDAGIKARASGVDRLLAIGSASRHAVEAFGEGAMFFDSKRELISYIQQHKLEALAILIKGSRFMHMEQIVESLIKESD